MRTKLNKFLTLFTVGGSLYFIIEFLFKTFISGGMIHWSMFLLGGLCFVLIGEINEVIPWEMSIIKQGAIGAAIVTSLEFVFGVILNLVLKLGIWDYSNLPFNWGRFVFLSHSRGSDQLLQLSSLTTIFVGSGLMRKFRTTILKTKFAIKTKNRGEP